MPLTHEHWRDPARASDAEGMIVRPQIKGKLDPIEIRDGHVTVRPFKENFYGHTEGPHLTPEQEKQEAVRTLIEVKKSVIDRLKNRRAELLARMDVLSKDPAFDARGALEQLERAYQVEVQTQKELKINVEKIQHGMGRVSRFFSERYGVLYVPMVALKTSDARLNSITKSLEEMHTDSKKIKEIAAEMERHNTELLLIDADQNILQDQLTELITSARKQGWVRDVITKRPETMPASGRRRKRTLTAGA